MKQDIRLLVIVFFLTFISVQAQVKLPAVFGSNMVLQQKTSTPIWGKAAPNLIVAVNANWGATAKTVAGSDSLWKVKIKTPKAGGPYKLQIIADHDTITFTNVMIGEVWICSGQSNMEMPLEGWTDAPVEGSADAIKNSTNSNIRFFTAAHWVSDKPEFDCKGSWSESNPETAAKFSATAYFFGEKLYDELKIPIGLIHASWGGTPIEAWTSGKAISKVDQYKNIFENIEKGHAEFQALKDWLNAKPIIDVSKREKNTRWQNLQFDDSTCSAVQFNDSSWKEMNLPRDWENSEVGNFDGALWFRKKVEIPESWINKELILELGPIDDIDLTYVNGQKVGGYEAEGFWKTNRIYSVPAELVNERMLTVAVRVIDYGGGGGVWGLPEQLKLHPKNFEEKVSLAGNWKYLPVAEYANEKFYVYGASGKEFYKRPHVSFDYSANSPTTLYNGMIAPLIPYAVKGAIWYQGEANTDQPELYKTLFPLMISNWREDWQQKNFSFYFVQIAPFEYGPVIESQKLREAQLETLRIHGTGMAVTLDIDDSENIHPAKKKEVGERLALWALAKDYGKKLICSGPLYKSMKRVKNKIIITFDHADGLRLIPINSKNNFQIAGEDSVFKNAVVEIKRNTVVVSSLEITDPVAVRYCWGNTTAATLFNKVGLPASSFRTDSWK